MDVAGSSVTLSASEARDYSFTWTGTVTLPAGSGPFRVRLTESENYLYVPYGGLPTYASRVVYLDTLDV